MDKPYPRCAFGKHLRSGTIFSAFSCIIIPYLLPLLTRDHLPFVIADLLRGAFGILVEQQGLLEPLDRQESRWRTS